MNVDKFASRVFERMSANSKHGGALHEPTDQELTVYALMMTFALPQAEQSSVGYFPSGMPHPSYTADYCRAELQYLYELGVTTTPQAEELEPLIGELKQTHPSRPQYQPYIAVYNILYGVIADFMPVWCFCTSDPAYSDRRRLPVYIRYQDYRESAAPVLVNRALAEPFEAHTNTNYPIPLRELLYGTWYRFDAPHPRPFDFRRADAVIERLRIMQ